MILILVKVGCVKIAAQKRKSGRIRLVFPRAVDTKQVIWLYHSDLQVGLNAVKPNIKGRLMSY
ncbi:MAG: hypothetical protein GY795_47055 [Desulfobacterales bacterium]|nr:hypothetical protein [Desulfobacterales bacterium]